MTRNEAINKLKSFNYDKAAESFVDMAEALGLIKFDDTLPTPKEIIDKQLKVWGYSGLVEANGAEGIINILHKNGYKIVEVPK